MAPNPIILRYNFGNFVHYRGLNTQSCTYDVVHLSLSSRISTQAVFIHLLCAAAQCVASARFSLRNNGGRQNGRRRRPGPSLNASLSLLANNQSIAASHWRRDFFSLRGTPRHSAVAARTVPTLQVEFQNVLRTIPNDLTVDRFYSPSDLGHAHAPTHSRHPGTLVVHRHLTVGHIKLCYSQLIPK